MSGLPRILVVGGAGVFGGRLADGLAATVPCEVVLAGRDAARAGTAAAALLARNPGAAASAVSLDAGTATAKDLEDLGLAAVADAAGPYREGGYHLPLACVRARVPYLDLADGRAYVAGFAAALHERALDAGVAAVCGASSTPALSNAALDAIASGWRTVESVEVAISPGNRAPRGLSVFRSILSYVGRPVRVLRDGSWEDAPGWGLTVTRDMPGLGPRRLSLCETPDLDIMPARHPGMRTALFRAGLELRGLHDGLRLAALPVRAGILPSLVPLAPAFRRAATWVEGLGTDRGGMTVTARGFDMAGAPARAEWSLVAESGDGPSVPTLPALALLRATLAGRGPAPGAGPCVGILSLAAIEAEMGRLRIRTTTEPGPTTAPERTAA